jgi:molecular chaperone GrpE
MHDATPAADAGPTDLRRRPAPGYLTADRIDRTLADFRTYLEALLEPPPAPDAPPEPFDLSALVAQFTALRHDVNLQTKAVRAVAEQGPVTAPKSVPTDNSAPLVKALIEIADALIASHRQMEGVRVALEPLVAKLASPPSPPKVPRLGFFARLFGATAVAPTPNTAAAEAAAKLSPLPAGVGDGYTMSLRRVEKALEAAGLEAIPAVGRVFDPEKMEAVELAGGGPSGTVVEEVRRGYIKGGAVVRFALVKVAR